MRTLTWFNAHLARYGMYCAVGGLMAIVAVVAWQVFGRYVLNASPTWAENLALVLILYVTLIGAAGGVRDAGHIGMVAILALVPGRLRKRNALAVALPVGALRGGTPHDDA